MVGEVVPIHRFLRHIIDAVVGVGGNGAPLVLALDDLARSAIAANYVVAVRIRKLYRFVS